MTHPLPLTMPAEWERQSAIWLSWPHNQETWPENLEAAQREFSDLVRTIATTERVMVMVDFTQNEVAVKTLGSWENVTCVDIPTNDAWARDYASTFVIDSQRELVAVDWEYNAWGGKYPPYDLDQQVAKRVAGYLGVAYASPSLCIEGGAIEVNDRGVLLCTRSCALNPNRNPGMDVEEVESILKQYLGVKVCLWLTGNAIEGDDTDGHIDQIARFVNPTTIVVAADGGTVGPQRDGLKQNRKDLEQQLEFHGLEHYRLISLPLPSPFTFCGRAIPASYCNFLITNELVVVPQFGVDEDEGALQILGPLFPDRQILGLPSKNIAVGLGSFHCLSQQQPENRKNI